MALAEIERDLRAAFVAVPTRASVTFVGVEPIEVLRFAEADRFHFVTLGLARHPMGDESATGVGPRAELCVETWTDAGDLWRRLAVLAAAPVVEGVVYTDGMIVDLGEPRDVTSRCTGGLIVTSELGAVDSSWGDVQILRLIPATSTELVYARVRGVAALRARWAAAGTDLLDLARAAVDLS